MKLRMAFFASLSFALTVQSLVPLRASTLNSEAPSIMPLPFTKNMGQWPDEVLFRTTSHGVAIWITKTGVVYQFTRRVPREESTSHARRNTGPAETAFDRDPLTRGDLDHGPDSVEQLIVKAKFVGSNPEPQAIGTGELEYKCNYFLGDDPAKWRTDVPNYDAVILRDVYHGVNLKYSGDEASQAVVELITTSESQKDQVAVEYEGAPETSLNADGRRIVRTQWGDTLADLGATAVGATLISPRVFSRFEPSAQRDPTSAANRASSAAVGLAYSTYLGGSSSDYAHGIVVDTSGAAYVTGRTSSANFPTANAYQSVAPGGDNAFVTKVASAGNSLIYSTYLGGSNTDVGEGIAVDTAGAAYVTGTTSSVNFPTANAYQATFGGGAYDAFVTKLSSAGNSLIYSTYLGGGTGISIYVYEVGLAIAVDASGAAYVTGETISTSFPTANAYQAAYAGGDYDAFVTKLSGAGNSLVYSTYLGGSGSEEAFLFSMGIAADASGAAYITGGTNSANFPTANAYQATYGGGFFDAFLTKLSSAGNSLVYSTYLGGSDADYGYSIEVDASGAAYASGSTSSSNFPTANAYQATYGGVEDAFVAKLSSAGTSLDYSTYLGGSQSDRGYGVDLDESSEEAYVTGSTGSSNFPTANAYQAAFGGGVTDAFVTKLSNTGSSLDYSTYLGGSIGDFGYAIAVDASGAAYAAGQTASVNFPTSNAFQATLAGGNDAFVTKLVPPSYTGGDVNNDGSITSADIIYLVNFVFKSGPAPQPVPESGDVNCNGSITSADVIYLVNYVFKGGAAPC